MKHISYKLKANHGFTLIELLIVVAIISILAGIILVSLTSAKAKSRDAKRMSDMNEIQKALNLYFTENNTFPIFTSEVTISGDDAFSTLLENAGHISETPIDPTHPANAYTYLSNSTGSDFTLGFCLETDTIPRYQEGCGNTISP